MKIYYENEKNRVESNYSELMSQPKNDIDLISYANSVIAGKEVIAGWNVDQLRKIWDSTATNGFSENYDVIFARFKQFNGYAFREALEKDMESKDWALIFFDYEGKQMCDLERSHIKKYLLNHVKLSYFFRGITNKHLLDLPVSLLNWSDHFSAFPHPTSSTEHLSSFLSKFDRSRSIRELLNEFIDQSCKANEIDMDYVNYIPVYQEYQELLTYVYLLYISSKYNLPMEENRFKLDKPEFSDDNPSHPWKRFYSLIRNDLLNITLCSKNSCGSGLGTNIDNAFREQYPDNWDWRHLPGDHKSNFNFPSIDSFMNFVNSSNFNQNASEYRIRVSVSVLAGDMNRPERWSERSIGLDLVINKHACTNLGDGSLFEQLFRNFTTYPTSGSIGKFASICQVPHHLPKSYLEAWGLTRSEVNDTFYSFDEDTETNTFQSNVNIISYSTDPTEVHSSRLFIPLSSSMPAYVEELNYLTFPSNYYWRSWIMSSDEEFSFPTYVYVNKKYMQRVDKAEKPKLLPTYTGNSLSRFTKFIEELSNILESQEHRSLFDLYLERQNKQFTLYDKFQSKMLDLISLNVTLLEAVLDFGLDWEKFEKWFINLKDVPLNLIDLLSFKLSDFIDFEIDDWKFLISFPEMSIFFAELALSIQKLKMTSFSFVLDFFKEISLDFSKFKIDFSGTIKDWAVFLNNLLNKEETIGNKVNSFVNFVHGFDFTDGKDFVTRTRLKKLIHSFDLKYPKDLVLSFQTFFDDICARGKQAAILDEKYLSELYDVISSNPFTVLDKCIPMESKYVFMKPVIHQHSRSIESDSGLSGKLNAIDNAIGDFKMSLSFSDMLSGLFTNLWKLLTEIIKASASVIVQATDIITNIFNLNRIEAYPLSAGEIDFFEGFLTDDQESVILKNVVPAQFCNGQYVKNKFGSAYFVNFFDRSNYPTELVLYTFNDDHCWKMREVEEDIWKYPDPISQFNYLINLDDTQYYYQPTFTENVVAGGLVTAQAAAASASAALSTPGWIAKIGAAASAATIIATVNSVAAANYHKLARQFPYSSILNEIPEVSLLKPYFGYITGRGLTIQPSSSVHTMIEVAQEVAAIVGGFVSAIMVGVTVGSIVRYTSNKKKYFERKSELRKQEKVYLGSNTIDTDKLTNKQLAQLVKADLSPIKYKIPTMSVISSLSPAAQTAALKSVSILSKASKNGLKVMSNILGNASGFVGSLAGSALGSSSGNKDDVAHDIKELRSLMEIINRKLGF